MPQCMGARKEAQAEVAEKEWREPPGYLGEAVRRAKRIPPGLPPPPPPP